MWTTTTKVPEIHCSKWATNCFDLNFPGLNELPMEDFAFVIVESILFGFGKPEKNKKYQKIWRRANIVLIFKEKKK